MKRTLIILTVLALACFAMPVFAADQPNLITPAPAAADSTAMKLTLGPDTWLKVGFLLQAQYNNAYTWDEAAGETDSDGMWDSSFKIRRARIMMMGQVAPNVTFFVETDNTNIGGRTAKNAPNDGAVSSGTFIQDAFVTYKVSREFQIDMGMMLVPFMHHERESAVSLLGIDYNTNVIKIPTSNNWRDTGVELRGLLLGNLIDYRVGVFQGVTHQDADGDAVTTKNDVLNPDGMPRFIGRVQINLLDAEDAFFYSGNYLGKKRIVSFGGGVDYQSDSVANGNGTENSFSWTADVVVDYPINPTTVIAFQAAYVKMKWNTTAAVENANAYFAQLGVLLNGVYQPTIRYSTFVAENPAGDNTSTYLTVGFNYFINAHNANVKIEYQHPMGTNDATKVDQIDKPNQKLVTLQFQVCFW